MLNKFKLSKEIIGFFVLALILGGSAGVSIYKTKQAEKLLRLKEARIANISQQITGLNIEAQAVAIQNLTLGERWFGQNDTAPLPLASLIKIMTVLIALEGGYDEVVISKEALNELGDSELSIGDLWHKSELAKLALVESSNDAAFALASYDGFFVERMNAKAQELGLEHTSFSNVTGLDMNANTPGGQGSAFDMNVLAYYALLYHPEIFSSTTQKTLELVPIQGAKHTSINTNLVLEQIPSLEFSKTGLTKLAGGNLTIIFRNAKNEQIAITILGSSETGRFSEMTKLVNLLYNI